jgi:hypothetical protein
MHHFYCSGGPVRITRKVRHDTVRRTCVFTSGRFCGSRSAFQCIRVTKCRCTNSHDGVGLVWIQQKARRDMLRRTCVFPSGGITGHVLHSCASGAQNVDALFFMLGWARCNFHKKHVGTSYIELVFFHPVRSAGHVAHSVHPGCKTLMNYFSFLCGPGAVSIKSVSWHVTMNLFFCIRWVLWVT